MHIPFSFNFPYDGAVLFDSAGKVSKGELTICCHITADPGSRIEVNNRLCYTEKPTDYRCEVTLKYFRNIICARDLDTGEETQLVVFFAHKAHIKYQFALDDNIWCFQNIAKNQHIYKSIFEDPWLSMLKSLHDKYGTKFQLNSYYECPENGGFVLSDMPDKYKDEWEGNSDWLRMAFHARANLPDRTYRFGTYDQILRDAMQVHEEIVRFAGDKSLETKATTIHFGDCNVECVRALRSLGVRMLGGTFSQLAKALTNTAIAYYLTDEQIALVSIYGFYYDKTEDMFFRLGGLKAQHTPIDKLWENFDRFTADHPLYTFRSPCVHEEYFYPFYSRYMPDYEKRFDTVIRYFVEHGYKSEFVSDIMDF